MKQETYDFEAATGALTPHRAKEEADDYRYFPEPDLVPVEPAGELVGRLRAELPEPPGARIRRLEQELDLERATVLVTGGLDRLWSDTPRGGRGRCCRRQRHREQPGRRRHGSPTPCLRPSLRGSSRLATASRDRPSTRRSRRWRIPGSARIPISPRRSLSDEADLEPIVERILAENPGQVDAYRGGKEGLLGFFVGQVMKETGGKANAQVVSELVKTSSTASAGVRLQPDPVLGFRSRSPQYRDGVRLKPDPRRDAV